MQLLFRELLRYKSLVIIALILASINQIFSMLDPQLFRLIIDNFATKADQLDKSVFISGILILLLGSVGVALVSRVAKAFQDYYVNVITQRVGTNLYSKSVDHAFSLPFSIFEDERSGEILNKLQKARTDSQALISNTINILFFSLIGILFAVGYAVSIHWFIGLSYVLIIPTIGTAIFILSKKIKQAQQAIVKETAALSGSTTETLRNVELVKSLGLDEQEIKRLNKVNEKILGLEIHKVKIVRKLDFTQGTLINALRSTLLFVMLWFIFEGTISIGQFLTLWIYQFFIFAPLASIGQLVSSYQEARASLEQLEGLFRLDPIKVPENAKKVERVDKIEYKGISHSYDSGAKEALRDISIEISAGKSVALVGPSGSGKSTMIKILLGLYTPTKGSVLINDVDIKDIDPNTLRKKVGLVAQDTQLFAGTVRENLLFVKPKATDGECIEALKLAQAYTILERTNMGLETKIGEGGLKLSGGEKQRLAIARALLRNPDLIIFDEATSSLDSITESHITNTIKNLKKTNKNLTQILVAHRLSTIVHADRIFVFEKGRIIESGTHEELLDNNNLYAALWREQSAEKSIK